MYLLETTAEWRSHTANGTENIQSMENQHIVWKCNICLHDQQPTSGYIHRKHILLKDISQMRKYYS